MVDKNFYANNGKSDFKIPTYEPAKTVTLEGDKIVEKYSMEKIGETENKVFYRWNIAALK